MKKIIPLVFVFIISVSFLCAKSIWVDSGELFLDRKPLKVGDPITVVFNNSTIIKYKAQSRQNATSKLLPPTAQSPMLSFLPSVDYGSSMNYNKNVNSTSDGTFKGSITVSVSEIRDGSLAVAGTHTLVINGEEESISINALASPRLIRKGYIIYSTDLINPTITYKGLTVSKGTKYTPENVTVTTDEAGATTVEFTEEQKNQIIIDYLNRTLDTLFNY